jgi:hypothetical protein
VTELIVGDLDLLAWADTDEGELLGPVAASSLRFRASDDPEHDIVIELTFEFGTRDHAVRPRGLRIELAGTIHQHAIDVGVIHAGDSLTVVQALHGAFDDRGGTAA